MNRPDDDGPAAGSGGGSPVRRDPGEGALVGRELVERYRAGLPERIAALEGALSRLPADPDVEEGIRALAHDLRGSGTSYGFPEITARATRVEEAGRADLAGEVGGLLEALRGAAEETAGGSTVLLVEDDPEIRYLLEVVLGDEGRTVVSVAGAEAARKVLEARPVDLVVLDLSLPDADGRALLRQLRRSPATAHLPVLVVSAHDEPSVEAECFRLGADAYFRKPFDPGTLEAAAATHLARRLQEGDRARLDPRTGLLGREGIRKVWEAAGDGASLTLALLALDGFDRVAVRHGWAVAQRALEGVASILSATLADAGRVGRWEGDTFAVVFQEGSDEAGVAAGLEAALEGVRAMPVEGSDGETFRLTASAGVSSGTPTRDVLDDVLDRARVGLHRARAAGGNRIGGRSPDERRRRVVVAEDDDLTAALLQHRLERDGFDVEWHTNGADAFEAALRSRPDLVVLDVRMPGMDGFELLERLRKVGALRDVPIMLLTSMGSEADLVRGFRLGADDYVLKPFSPTEVLARVHRLVSRRP